MLLFRKTFSYFFKSKKYHTSYFERIINNYKYTDSYLNLFNSLESLKTECKTSEKITFFNDIDFGAHLNRVKSRIKGSFRIVKKIKFIDVLFMEVKLGSYKFIVELHFFKQQLVCFRYIFRDQNEKEVFINLIAKKYFNLKKLDLFNSYVKDEKSNYIFIEKEVDFSINYITYEYGFYNYLLESKFEKEIDESLQHEKAIAELYDIL
ncbi:hypothetical protein [Tenacibaculum agarivorans]|uniref:hypothetical protein n=1 Tax=Tenacibaculum agarivorans TaxID=1908389 RepID=UPI00094BBD31|nr:hypothetical protein [Tenacibaculum agarivorans]